LAALHVNNSPLLATAKQFHLYCKIIWTVQVPRTICVLILFRLTVDLFRGQSHEMDNFVYRYGISVGT
jgi:hypothetical protein